MKALSSLKSFIEKCKRVWAVLKKPTKEEFLTVAKVSALGILVIGLIGFIVGNIVHIFFK
ncbi:protein translocase SEC61 complex subunit gamma [Candidatus Woesearchaeota archaeon]|jgi:protein transport protein SEC61 subunit gamma-like protein|nr:protein translocase SEC61 complex subunit gamma [Candidatus Woesearchaeota archaeon]